MTVRYVHAFSFWTEKPIEPGHTFSLDNVPEQEFQFLGTMKVELDDELAKALNNPAVIKIPIDSLDKPTLAHLAVAGGKFPSISQAIKQGCTGPCEVGSIVYWKKRPIIATAE